MAIDTPVRQSYGVSFRIRGALSSPETVLEHCEKGSVMSRKIACICLTVLCVSGLTLSNVWAQGQPGAAQPPQPAGQPPKPAVEPPKPPPAPGGAVQPPQPIVQPEEKPKLPDLVYVKLATTHGDIYLELNAAKAPFTVDNFLKYVDAGFYDGLIFHRVIKGFMIQGGGFDKDMKQKETRPGVKNEWQNGLKNKRGTISMARIGGKPDSGTSQFFINLVDNLALDIPRDGAGYTVFGAVIKGLEVVDKIGEAAVKLDQRADQGRPAFPVEPIIISKAGRVDPAELKDAIAAVRAQEAEEAKKVAEEAARKAELVKKDLEQGKEFVKSQGVDITGGQSTPSGLWWVDVTPGTGPSPVATDKVKVHYTGWLINGTKFDSSVDRGQPNTFGLGGVIKGWTEGVALMKVGGKRFFVIPPELAYGERGSPPKIPGNSVLVFQIELLGIEGK